MIVRSPRRLRSWRCGTTTSKCAAAAVPGACRPRPNGRAPEMGRLTLASVAARLRCAGCFTGPDEVHLTATVHGLEPPEFGGDAVWSIPLRCQERRPSYHHRRIPEHRTTDANSPSANS